jgi:hypothetical protein
MQQPGTAHRNMRLGFDVDAGGARAIVDRQWTLDSGGQGIGIIIGAVTCGDRLFLGDAGGGIRRLNLQTAQVAKPRRHQIAAGKRQPVHRFIVGENTRYVRAWL